MKKKVVLHPCNTFLVLHGISFPVNRHLGLFGKVENRASNAPAGSWPS